MELENLSEVQYIYDDSELNLDNLHTENLSEIILADGSTAYLLNNSTVLGCTAVDANDGQTITLEEDEDEMNQYYIPTDGNQIIIPDDDQSSSNLENAPSTSNSIIQYIDETNDALATNDSDSIIYVDNDTYEHMNNELSETSPIEKQDNVDSEVPLKFVQYGDEMIDLNDLLKQHVALKTDSLSYQYAVLKDGKLHLQSSNLPSHNSKLLNHTTKQTINRNKNSKTCINNIAQITGKDLKTGKTLKLEQHLKGSKRLVKEQKKISLSGKKTPLSRNVNHLINKRVTFGPIDENGKRWYTRILNIRKISDTDKTTKTPSALTKSSVTNDVDNFEASAPAYTQRSTHANQIIDIAKPSSSNNVLNEKYAIQSEESASAATIITYNRSSNIEQSREVTTLFMNGNVANCSTEIIHSPQLETKVVDEAPSLDETIDGDDGEVTEIFMDNEHDEFHDISDCETSSNDNVIYLTSDNGIEEIYENENTDELNVKKTIEEIRLEKVSRVLVGLMDMTSFRKKLLYKHIVAKVVEKKVNKDLSKEWYIGGYVEEVVVDGKSNWVFIPNADTSETAFTETKEEQVTSRYRDEVNITILTAFYNEDYHVKRVIFTVTKILKCLLCDIKFANLDDHLTHVLEQHCSGYEKVRICFNSTTTTVGIITGVVNKMVEVLVPKFGITIFEDPGNLAPLNFSNMENRKENDEVSVHVKTETAIESDGSDYTCGVCSLKLQTEEEWKAHATVHDQQGFACNICNKQFSSCKSLHLHRRFHLPHKYWACQICGRSFSRQSNLLRHVSMHESVDARFRCLICGSTFVHSSSLTRHMVKSHIDVSRNRKQVLDAITKHKTIVEKHEIWRNTVAADTLAEEIITE